ncbi:hypothetical protein H310_15007, partial [Aphanomyces invadans]
MEFPTNGDIRAEDVELPGSDHDGSAATRTRSGRSASPAARAPSMDRTEDRGRSRSQTTARRLFRSPDRRRQPVAVDEAWPYARATSTPFVSGQTTRTSSEATADEPNDVDMGQYDVVVRNAPALPKNPAFNGSTKEERRAFMAAYNLYISQTNALTANGVRHIVMPVSACIEPMTKQRVAEWDLFKDPDDVSEAEWIAWFKQGYVVDPRALDTLKKRIKTAV